LLTFQYWAIIKANSSTGLSYLSLATGYFSGMLTLVNTGILGWDKIVCCRNNPHLHYYQCLGNNLVAIQVAFSPALIGLLYDEVHGQFLYIFFCFVLSFNFLIFHLFWVILNSLTRRYLFFMYYFETQVEAHDASVSSDEGVEMKSQGAVKLREYFWAMICLILVTCFSILTGTALVVLV
jgi:hypothetical protein